jgi:hypothetical protein
MTHAHIGQPVHDQHCWDCVNFGGPAWGDSGCTWCHRDARRLACIAQPERGCAFFDRASDADDSWPGAGEWAPIAPPPPRWPAPAAPAAMPVQHQQAVEA